MTVRPIALYVRVSTLSQNLAAQEEELLRVGRARGWKAADMQIYREKASGASNSRPVLDSIMTAARSGKVKTLVVYKLDRLGRSLQHLLWVIAELGRLGVSVIATSQGIDTSQDSPIAKVQLAVLGAVAEFERDLIQDRIRLGRERAVRRGVILGRPAKLIGLTDRVRAMKAKGKSFAKIAKTLKISKQSAWRMAKKNNFP